MKRFAVIVAGGKGTRLGSGIPKQFRLIAGRPMLMRTVEAFLRADSGIRIIVVLPEAHMEYWESLCDSYGFYPDYTITNGGNTRWESVRNGLALIDGNGMVAIHDGARPLVSPSLINTAFEIAGTRGSAVPAVPPVDSMRIVGDDGKSSILDRNACRCIQTPQVFRCETILKAYRQPFCEHFTDDASVVEADGGTVNLIEGERNNIKVTTLQDIALAEIIIGGG